MQPLVELPTDKQLREEILSAFPDPPPFGIAGEQTTTQPIDVCIIRQGDDAGRGALYVIELMEGPGGADDIVSDEARCRIAEQSTAETWRVAIGLGLEIARLRRRYEESSRRAEDYFDQAHTDPLTGLANRRSWDTWTEALPETTAAVCMILDIDDFKGCNDSQGHAFGDQVLRSAADGLRRSLRQGDFVARIGGDEFAAWLPNVPNDIAAQIVERIRGQVLEQMRDALGDASPTVSIGAVVGKGEDGEDAESLLNDADTQLFDAKNAGRDQSRVM